MSPSDADRALLETSRTFYLPIVRLPSNLREAVTATYLCLRAIDEIEDHTELDPHIKSSLLQDISAAFKAHDLFQLEDVSNSRDDLASVTKRVSDWIRLAPSSIAPAIWSASGSMAERMAYWVRRTWRIHTQEELDNYTFDVAGSVGVLLSDLWYWYDGTQANKLQAVGFGRGLQTVNILRNRAADLARGVDFFPVGWSQNNICTYAKSNLSLATSYVDALPIGPAREFCRLPLDLAQATLDVIHRGEEKLSRTTVMQLARGPLDRKLTQSVPSEEMLVLVNEHDEVIGVEEKIRTHRLGALHRAFSIFVFNSERELLLQKRADTKYHSRGLWSNTCCGHPRFEESVKEACHRRLLEEMGFDCELTEVFSFLYRVELEDGLIEHEYDHVFIGHFNGTPRPDPKEVAHWKWERLIRIQSDHDQRPSLYTRWFETAITLLTERLQEFDHGVAATNGNESTSSPVSKQDRKSLT